MVTYLRKVTECIEGATSTVGGVWGTRRGNKYEDKSTRHMEGPQVQTGDNGKIEWFTSSARRVWVTRKGFEYNRNNMGHSNWSQVRPK